MLQQISACVIILTAVHCQATELPRTITVSGRGTAASAPDMVTVQSGVATVGKTAQQALAANNLAMQEITKLLTKMGVAKKDIQTTNFSVYPEYNRDPSPRATSKVNRVAGYRVSNSLTIRFRKLSELGQLLDALVQSGSNQISGVRFGLAQPNGILNQARERAVEDALARAQLYANATNTQVGRVLSISEQSLNAPRPAMMRAAAMEMTSAVPIAEGEQQMTASVNITYELIDEN